MTPTPALRLKDYMHSHIQANGKTLQQLGYTYANFNIIWNMSRGLLSFTPLHTHRVTHTSFGASCAHWCLRYDVMPS